MDDGSQTKINKVSVTLNDCLACSGCITSAETVLISAQSKEEFLRQLALSNKIGVVSISPQSRASIADYYGLSPKQTLHKLTTFFKQLGISYVFDISSSRDLALIEMRQEFIQRYLNNTNIPMLASACPGWVCYAEKTQGNYILPHICTTKSPQQIMGSIIKKYFSHQIGVSEDKIYHVTVMPCYDKKLEASREDFYDDVLSTHDVDCVLTSGEVVELIDSKQINFTQILDSPLDTLYTNVTEDGQLYGVRGSSGGYSEVLFKYAAKFLFNIDVQEVHYKTLKNNDMREAVLEIDGKVVLRFAIANGFRNIQNIVRNIKNKKCNYHFVEVMACPHGCLNGGGQVKPKPGESSKDVVNRLDQLYHISQEERNPELNPIVKNLYSNWLGNENSENAKHFLHTQYHNREKEAIPLMIKW